MYEAIKLIAQYALPQHLLSRWVGQLCECTKPWYKNWAIPTFMRRYPVDLSEALVTDPLQYANFNDFFTRALKPDARPIATGAGVIVSPADGAISQQGNINNNLLFQAKGHEYTVQALVGGDAQLAAQFQNGHFATVYLAPKDYHRVHMPYAGQLRQMIHVPGSLFSVNTYTTSKVPGLFARNERVICIFDTDLGPMAVILVGAFFVASISTTWAGTVTPLSKKAVRTWNYNTAPVHLERGAEVGQFKLGSTVIVLFANNPLAWDAACGPGAQVKMGAALGCFGKNG